MSGRNARPYRLYVPVRAMTLVEIDGKEFLRNGIY